MVKVVVYLLSSQPEEMVSLFLSSEECTGIAGSSVAAALGNAAWYLAGTLLFVTSIKLSEGKLISTGVGSSKAGMNIARY